MHNYEISFEFRNEAITIILMSLIKIRSPQQNNSGHLRNSHVKLKSIQSRHQTAKAAATLEKAIQTLPTQQDSFQSISQSNQENSNIRRASHAHLKSHNQSKLTDKANKSVISQQNDVAEQKTLPLIGVNFRKQAINIIKQTKLTISNPEDIKESGKAGQKQLIQKVHHETITHERHSNQAQDHSTHLRLLLLVRYVCRQDQHRQSTYRWERQEWTAYTRLSQTYAKNPTNLQTYNRPLPSCPLLALPILLRPYLLSNATPDHYCEMKPHLLLAERVFLLGILHTIGRGYYWTARKHILLGLEILIGVYGVRDRNNYANLHTINNSSQDSLEKGGLQQLKGQRLINSGFDDESSNKSSLYPSPMNYSASLCRIGIHPRQSLTNSTKLLHLRCISYLFRDSKSVLWAVSQVRNTLSTSMIDGWYAIRCVYAAQLAKEHLKLYSRSYRLASDYNLERDQIQSSQGLKNRKRYKILLQDHIVSHSSQPNKRESMSISYESQSKCSIVKSRHCRFMTIQSPFQQSLQQSIVAPYSTIQQPLVPFTICPEPYLPPFQFQVTNYERLGTLSKSNQLSTHPKGNRLNQSQQRSPTTPLNLNQQALNGTRLNYTIIIDIDAFMEPIQQRIQHSNGQLFRQHMQQRLLNSLNKNAYQLVLLRRNELPCQTNESANMSELFSHILYLHHTTLVQRQRVLDVTRTGRTKHSNTGEAISGQDSSKDNSNSRINNCSKDNSRNDNNSLQAHTLSDKCTQLFEPNNSNNQNDSYENSTPSMSRLILITTCQLQATFNQPSCFRVIRVLKGAYRNRLNASRIITLDEITNRIQQLLTYIQ